MIIKWAFISIFVILLVFVLIYTLKKLIDNYFDRIPEEPEVSEAQPSAAELSAPVSYPIDSEQQIPNQMISVLHPNQENSDFFSIGSVPAIESEDTKGQPVKVKEI